MTSPQVRWRPLLVVGLLVVGFALVAPSPAHADSSTGSTTAVTSSAVTSGRLPGLDLDCKDSPTPDRPDQGIPGFFGPEPDRLPPAEDPFEPDATTTVYEQYGFGGLRWHNYDLGCGVDAARNPEAVLGTTVANWTMNLPVVVAALTASLTDVAFHPTFLGVFDPLLTRVSDTLHDSLFARWAPAVVAAVGLLVLIKARGMALATAAGAIGWAMFVVLVATALFRWPTESGRFADDTVTTSLASVVQGLHRDEQATDPATLVASSVQQSILYPAWLAGELGSTDSETATKYGPGLFQAQTLSWREVHTVETDPEAGKRIINAKSEEFGRIADKVRTEDPAAYEFLTGQRSDTRVAYAIMAALATTFALPFLLVSALMLLASYFVVRLAVMLFPAFATIGLFPSARWLVVGVFRTVGAALVNAVLFGIGAAVTVVLIGVILDPATGLPLWLAYVLLPLFSLIAWLTLKPVRRVTSFAGHTSEPFQDGASLGHASDKSKQLGKRAAAGTAAAVTAGASAAAAALVASKHDDDDKDDEVAERAEARTTTTKDDASPQSSPPRPSTGAAPAPGSVAPSRPALEATGAEPWSGSRTGTSGTSASAPGRRSTGPSGRPDESWESPASLGSAALGLVPVEPEWSDGEEVYAIYRADEPELDEWGDPVPSESVQLDPDRPDQARGSDS